MTKNGVFFRQRFFFISHVFVRKKSSKNHLLLTIVRFMIENKFGLLSFAHGCGPGPGFELPGCDGCFSGADEGPPRALGCGGLTGPVEVGGLTGPVVVGGLTGPVEVGGPGGPTGPVDGAVAGGFGGGCGPVHGRVGGLNGFVGFVPGGDGCLQHGGVIGASLPDSGGGSANLGCGTPGRAGRPGGDEPSGSGVTASAQRRPNAMKITKPLICMTNKTQVLMFRSINVNLN